MISLVMLIAHSACHAQERDTIYMFNGQILIGQIRDANFGALTIDEIDLKLQSIKLYKIKRLVIFHRFRIETLDKRFLDGLLGPSEKEGWVNLYPANGVKETIRIIHIFSLVPLDREFIKRVHGNISAGVSFSKSSNIGQVNFNGNAAFSTRKVDYAAVASEIGSIDTGKYSRDNEYIQLYAAYNLTPTWFLSAAAQYQRNLELSIGRRYLELFGGGKKLVIKQTWELVAVTGISFTQEKSIAGETNGTSLEIPAMIRFDFFRFRDPDIQITSIETLYYSLSEAGRVRFDGSTSFSWQLVRYFYFKVSPYSNYDSKPPAASKSNFDIGIVVSLSYKF
ncbi:MAG: DUF481 domain-containing protein [Chitinophagales bacterium]